MFNDPPRDFVELASESIRPRCPIRRQLFYRGPDLILGEAGINAGEVKPRKKIIEV